HGPDNGVGRAPGPTRETVHLTDMSTFHPRTHSLGEVSPIQVPDAPVVLSSASVYPEKTPVAFEIAAKLGYDGVEVLVSSDPTSQDIDLLRRLSDYHQIPVTAVHSPCLVLTQRVWGKEPWGKLVRSQEMAEALGDRKSTRLNSSHVSISYAVSCLKKRR